MASADVFQDIHARMAIIGGYNQAGATDVSTMPVQIKHSGAAVVLAAGADSSGHGELRLRLSDGSSKIVLLANGASTFGTGTALSTAILQADSTTRCFYPPRMTVAQMQGISASSGAVVFAQLSGLCFFDTTGKWVSIKDT